MLALDFVLEDHFMFRSLIPYALAASVVCLPITASAQIAAAATAGAAAAAPHIIAGVPAILTGALSAGSAHVGQAVLAKVTSASMLSNGAKLPVGAQLLGHITQATPSHSKTAKSSLGMVFDRFRLPNGTTSPLSPSMLQAVGTANASAPENEQQTTGSNSNANSSSGGLLGGVVGAVGSTVNTVGSTVNGLVGTVTSLPGTLLDSTGTLVAQGRNVSVPAGTQITVAATASANAQ